MADTAIASPFDGLQGLLQNILGANTKTKDSSTLDTNQLLTTLMNGSDTTNQTQSGTQNTNALTQLLSQLTGNTTQSTQSNANVTDLQKVFQQQQAGITPDMLKAIFTEGAKAVPQLVATSANAVGARSSDNSPLATTLRDLNTNLTSQAAMQSQSMLKDSGTTAAQIADLTKSTTGNTTQTQNTNQNTTQNTAQTSAQQLQSVLDKLSNTSQNTAQTQVKGASGDSTTGINLPQTAGAAGLAALLGALNGGAGSSLLGSLKGLIPGLGGGDVTGNGDGTGLFGGADFLSGLGDTGAGFNVGSTGDYSNGYTDPGAGPINWFNDPTTPQFADGGIIGEKLSLGDSGKKQVHPALTTLIALAAMAGKGIGGGGTPAKQ